MSKNILPSQLINGLKEEIGVEVPLLNLVNLEQAMELVVRVEERNRVTNTKKQGFGTLKTGYSRGTIEEVPWV